MNRILIFASTLLLVSCDQAGVIPEVQGPHESCQFLLTRTHDLVEETLGLREPISIKYFGSCMCGGFQWWVRDFHGTERRYCYQALWDKENRFGVGTCHNKPGEFFFERGSVEEEALVAMFSRWLIQNFTLEELVAISALPEECRRDMGQDPSAQANFLLLLYENDLDRYSLATEILTCGD